MANFWKRNLIAGYLLSLALVACGGDAVTPTVAGPTSSRSTQDANPPTNIVNPGSPSPVANPPQTAPVTPTGAARPTIVPSPVGNTVPPTLTPDPNAFNGKDGLCSTLVALPLSNLKTAQTSFSLTQALAAQTPVIKAYKADARPFAASLLCSSGFLSWSINWTSNAQKQSWVFSSFARDSKADLEQRVKEGLAVYAEPNAVALPGLPSGNLAGLDKLAQNLSTKGFNEDAAILSLTLSPTPLPARYIVIIDQGKTQPPVTVNLDSVTGSVLG